MADEQIVVQIKGVDAAVAKLIRAGESAAQAAGTALYRVGEQIMTDSKEHYVPVDTGVLRESGYVEPPKQNGAVVQVILGYGGPAAAYATVQHERIDFHHKVGQALFLRIPTLLRTDALGAQVATALQEMLERLAGEQY